MLTTILIGAAALAQAAATAPPTAVAPGAAATTGRTLRDLPRTTITYYDIAGKNGPAIEKALKKTLADPAKKDVVRLFNWDVGTQIMKQTTGTKCTIKSATSTLTSKVQLPRLAEEAKVPKDVQANWKTYITGVEKEAADNLWFVSDRLRGAEQSLVGMDCAQATSAWNAKLDAVKTALNAYIAQRQAQPKSAKR